MGRGNVGFSVGFQQFNRFFISVHQQAADSEEISFSLELLRGFHVQDEAAEHGAGVLIPAPPFSLRHHHHRRCDHGGSIDSFGMSGIDGIERIESASEFLGHCCRLRMDRGHGLAGPCRRNTLTPVRAAPP